MVEHKKKFPASAILWFRQDLRLDDNPALHAALADGRAVVPVFIFDPESEGHWQPGGASRCWLFRSLESLDAALRKLGSRLVIRQGESLRLLLELAQEAGADYVFWNRRYEPAIVRRDQAIKENLRAKGLIAESSNALLLFEPWTVQTKSRTPFRVFTPFYRACLAQPEPAAPIAAPMTIRSPAKWPASAKLDELDLLPRISWDAGIRNAWQCGEAAATNCLEQFLADGLKTYLDTRDRPDLEGSSQLSPYLHFGELSPRRLWHAAHEAMHSQAKSRARECAEGYLREIIWREFAYHLLFSFPHSDRAPLVEDYATFPWRDNPKALKAWQRGMTGYPIVDAGMRQLWSIGWMHNRVRMLVASFLVKDLLIPWQRGAEWFWDTLVDADLANNTLGWQWVAGCGADASPFFRIFNPVTQGEKFDPAGDYVRHWVPELANLADKWIHRPWEAPQIELHEAGIRLGQTYPRPMVDHAAARTKALEVWEKWRGRPPKGKAD